MKLFFIAAIMSWPPWGMIFFPLGFEVQIIGLIVQLVGLAIFLWNYKRHIY
jgi:hypothetical protein